MYDELRERATTILSQQTEIKRSLFVEFAGTPKNGKSTCIDTVSHFFRRIGYKVLAPTEGASKRTPYYLKGDWVAFNVWSASYALTHILEGLHGSDQYHLVILDRGLFDASAWFELLHSENDIDETQRDVIQQFFLLDKWRKEIDLVFLFKTDPETSLKRENQNTLITEPGRAMNPELLNKLNNAYGVVREKFSDRFNRFVVVDTSEANTTTPQSTAAEVVGNILDVLDERISS